jgi:hypothetical protein
LLLFFKPARFPLVAQIRVRKQTSPEKKRRILKAKKLGFVWFANSIQKGLNGDGHTGPTIVAARGQMNSLLASVIKKPAYEGWFFCFKFRL